MLLLQNCFYYFSTKNTSTILTNNVTRKMSLLKMSLLKIITDHWLFLSNDQVLDYELSIISRYYVVFWLQLIQKITGANVTMSTIQNNVGIRQILIYISNGVMVDINPSSHRPCAKFSKQRPMNRLCNRSSIGSAKPALRCENRADSQRRFIRTPTHVNTQLPNITGAPLISPTPLPASSRMRAARIKGAHPVCVHTTAPDIQADWRGLQRRSAATRAPRSVINLPRSAHLQPPNRSNDTILTPTSLKSVVAYANGYVRCLVNFPRLFGGFSQLSPGCATVIV